MSSDPYALPGAPQPVMAAMPNGQPVYVYAMPMQGAPQPVMMAAQPQVVTPGGGFVSVNDPNLPTAGMDQVPLAKPSSPFLSSAATIRKRLEAREYNVDISRWLNEGWAIFKNSPAQLLVVGIIMVALGFIPYGIGILIQVPLMAGLYMAIADTLRASASSTQLSWRTTFLGVFTQGPYFFLSVLAVMFLYSFLVAMGFLFLIVPGIMMAIAFSFSVYLIVEFKVLGVGIMDALLISSHVTWKRFGEIFVFHLAMFGVEILGLLCLGVGIFVAFPVCLAAKVVAFRDIFGLRDAHLYDMESPATF